MDPDQEDVENPAAFAKVCGLWLVVSGQWSVVNGPWSAGRLPFELGRMLSRERLRGPDESTITIILMTIDASTDLNQKATYGPSSTREVSSVVAKSARVVPAPPRTLNRPR